MLFGLFSNGITIVMGGCAAIFSGLSALDAETMDSFCPGSEAAANEFELFEDVGQFVE